MCETLASTPSMTEKKRKERVKTKIQPLSQLSLEEGWLCFFFFPFLDFSFPICKMGLLCCMPVLEPFVQLSLEARALEIVTSWDNLAEVTVV